MSDSRCIILLTESPYDRGKIIKKLKIANDPLHICISNNKIILELPESLNSDTIVILNKYQQPSNNAPNINAIAGMCSEFILAIHDMNNDYEKRSRLLTSNLQKMPNTVVNYTTAERNKVKEWIENFIKIIRDQLNEKFDKLFNELWNIFSTCSMESTINHLLHLFLPLDIDMQALEILSNKKENEKIINYLTNADDGMLRDKTVNYKEKLKKAQKEIEGVPKFKDNPVLKKLLGMNTEKSKISEFLGLLDKKKQKAINGGDIEDSEINEIITHFSKDGGWKVKGADPEVITSFHNWYCALAECLKGEKTH